MATNSTQTTEQPRASEVATSAWFAALAAQYTELLVCWDHEDGYFLKWGRWKSTGGWEVMDKDGAEKRTTLAEAIEAAVQWHNADIKPFNDWRRRIEVSSANAEISNERHE